MEACQCQNDRKGESENMNKFRISYLFLLLSITLVLLSITDSGAMNSVGLAREVSLNVTGDSNGVIELVGFDSNHAMSIEKDYVKTGVIINNSNQMIRLKLTMTADFAKIRNKNCWLGIRIGYIEREFTINDNHPKEISLLLAPGQAADVWAALTHNQNENVVLSFLLNASDLGNNISIQLKDTIKTPRRLVFY